MAGTVVSGHARLSVPPRWFWLSKSDDGGDCGNPRDGVDAASPVSPGAGTVSVSHLSRRPEQSAALAVPW
jgi:hypothetical protein